MAVSTESDTFFPFSDHTMMPRERDFGDIERKLRKSKCIYTPSEYVNLTKDARVKNKFHVTEMVCDEFLGITPLANALTKHTVTTGKEKIDYRKVHQFRITRNKDKHRKSTPLSTALSTPDPAKLSTETQQLRCTTDILPGTVEPALATNVLPSITEPAPDVMTNVLPGTVKPASVLPGIIEPAPDVMTDVLPGTVKPAITTDVLPATVELAPA